MKHEQTKRAKRIGWVSLVVGVAVCSHFAHFIAQVFHKARSLRSLTSSVGNFAARTIIASVTSTQTERS